MSKYFARPPQTPATILSSRLRSIRFAEPLSSTCVFSVMPTRWPSRRVFGIGNDPERTLSSALLLGLLGLALLLERLLGRLLLHALLRVLVLGHRPALSVDEERLSVLAESVHRRPAAGASGDLSMSLPARGRALVSGSLRATERLRKPAPKRARGVAGGARPGAKAAVDGALRLARQPWGEQRQHEQDNTDDDNAADQHWTLLSSI